MSTNKIDIGYRARVRARSLEGCRMAGKLSGGEFRLSGAFRIAGNPAATESNVKY